MLKWLRRLPAEVVSDMADKGGSRWAVWLAWWLSLAPVFCGVLAIVALAGGIDWPTAVGYAAMVVLLPLLFRLVDRLVWQITKSRREAGNERAHGAYELGRPTRRERDARSGLDD